MQEIAATGITEVIRGESNQQWPDADTRWGKTVALVMEGI